MRVGSSSRATVFSSLMYGVGSSPRMLWLLNSPHIAIEGWL